MKATIADGGKLIVPKAIHEHADSTAEPERDDADVVEHHVTGDDQPE